MKNKFVLLFFMVFSCLCLNSRGVNSLPPDMNFDSLRVKAQKVINTSEEIVYLDSMLQLAHALDSTRLQCQAMSFMARNYYNRMIPDSLMYWAEKVD